MCAGSGPGAGAGASTHSSPLGGVSDAWGAVQGIREGMVV